jgi:hypothetical protein
MGGVRWGPLAARAAPVAIKYPHPRPGGNRGIPWLARLSVPGVDIGLHLIANGGQACRVHVLSGLDQFGNARIEQVAQLD